MLIKKENVACSLSRTNTYTFQMVPQCRNIKLNRDKDLPPREHGWVPCHVAFFLLFGTISDKEAAYFTSVIWFVQETL